MESVSWSIIILVVSAAGAWLSRARTPVAAWLGAGGCLAAGAFGLWGAGNCLIQHQIESSRNLWNVPFGSLNLGLDSLSALFLVPAFLIGSLCALAALRRLPGDYAANRPHEHWLFFNLALAGAITAVVARNAVLFLFAWETMTVASFLLIENDQRRAGNRSGGWVYLTAGHIGGACLFAMFALLGAASGSLDFTALRATGGMASIVFVLGFAGFGGKAGLVPFHAWYPESYSAAPAHVGALLSGVIGNVGIYGFFRLFHLLRTDQPPPAWWGFLLLFSGLASVLLGAARSLASRDLVRLLAWSSVKNYGLMAAGMGLGLFGVASNNPLVSFLGFAAAIFHMLNHSIAKALLFLSAGAIFVRSGTRMIDHMGGMLKRLPLTGLLFLVGGLGAAAVPPLNGFASEFLLLMSAYHGAAVSQADAPTAAAMAATIAIIALIGGLAAAAFIKAFGFVFLGYPRGPGAASSGVERRDLLIPHLILGAAAVYVSLVSPRILSFIRPTAENMGRILRAGGDAAAWRAVGAEAPLFSAATGSWLLAGCLALAFLVRFLLTMGKGRASVPTWDCGYAKPDGRMQYTAASFVRPLVETFRICINPEDREIRPDSSFPGASSFSSSVPGVDRAWGYGWLFSLVARIAARVRLMQTGQVQTYLLYMAVTLVVLLLWKL